MRYVIPILLLVGCAHLSVPDAPVTSQEEYRSAYAESGRLPGQLAKLSLGASVELKGPGSSSSSPIFRSGTVGQCVFAASGSPAMTCSNSITVTGVAGGSSSLIIPFQTYISLDPTNNNSFIRAPSSGQIEVATTSFRPAANNTTALGTATEKWSNVSALGYTLASLLASGTAPTISAAGTSPSVLASNGTASFRVDVGTGGTATGFTMTFPAATTRWVCSCQNVTTPTTVGRIIQTSGSTTTCVMEQRTATTNVALAFAAGDDVDCIAYGH